MSSSHVRIRLKLGGNEVEIEGSPDTLREAIQFLPQMMEQLPIKEEKASLTLREYGRKEEVEGPTEELPEIRVERDDSLTDIITKLFKQPWGKKPRRLSDVRDALESYGLIYPKQSVAVALLRLAQAGKLRRFKGEEGDFVYTASAQLTLEEGNLNPRPMDRGVE